MLPYAIAFALPALFYPLRKQGALAYVFLLSAAWSVFAGLRVDIGGSDYFAYRDYFINSLAPGSWAGSNWEPLFKSVAWICRSVGLGYHGFLIVIALLGILPSSYVIEKRSQGNPVGLFIYGVEWMFYGSFVILRQGVAIGFAFLAFDALMDKRFKGFAVATACAIGFHYSALALLILPFFNWELKPWLRMTLFTSAGFVFLIIEGFSIFRVFELAYMGKLGARLLVYLVGGAREPINLLNVIEIAGLAYLVRRYASHAVALIRNSYFLYVCLAMASLQHAILLRFGFFFEIAVALLIPVVTDTGKDRGKERILFSTLLVLYYCAKIVRWLLLNASGPGGFLPYKAFL